MNNNGKTSKHKVMQYFEEISRIPRCSKKEERISNYLHNWALEKGFRTIQDEYMNVIIFKEGTPGYENEPSIILQGHMDMVCEKNADKIHDFANDPLTLIYEEDFVTADNTTLGADNGIAVAMMMAILDSDELSHPPLEIVITTDEETGMTGAKNFDASVLKGRKLINLDSEEEGLITAGCAGGGRVSFELPLIWVESKKNTPVRIDLKGLKGGHSGADIHLDRGNANKIMGRILREIASEVELVEVTGGSAENVIPREGSAIIKTNSFDNIEKQVKEIVKTIENEYTFSETEIRVETEALQSDYKRVLSNQTFERYTQLINQIPYGPLKSNREVDLVILSNNPGVVKTNKESIQIVCAPRSSIQSSLDAFVGDLVQLGEMTGCVVSKKAFYPGWQFSLKSPLRDLMIQVYEEMNDNKAKVIAIHAGLECGFFIEKMPDLDAVSIGPNMYDIHSPKEKLSISSSIRTYEYLAKILSKRQAID